jgi:hypothetical protein
MAGDAQLNRILNQQRSPDTGILQDSLTIGCSKTSNCATWAGTQTNPSMARQKEAA